MNATTPDLVSILASTGRTLAGTARALDVSPHHLRHAAKGRVHACPEVREGLAKMLGEPIEDLLPAEALDAPYDAARAEYRSRRDNPWPSPSKSTRTTSSARGGQSKNGRSKPATSKSRSGRRKAP